MGQIQWVLRENVCRMNLWRSQQSLIGIDHKKESLMHRLIGIACLSGAVMLAACATTEEVEKAQATANQALSAAGAAHSAAQAADQKADLAGQRAAQAAQMAQTANQTAMQAQANANAAQTAAQIATAKSQEVDNRLTLARDRLENRLAQSGRPRAPAPKVARGERD